VEEPKQRFVRASLRLLAVVCAPVLALAAASPALAASKTSQPPSGFYVFKDSRSSGATEFRDGWTGRIASRNVEKAGGGSRSACSDPRHNIIGARWRGFEPFLVNTGSTPGHLSSAEALADLRAAHSAWEHPFVTDCPNVPGTSRYDAIFGGPTTAPPSLATLEFDGENTVAFGRLEDTVCAGPGVVACVVAYSKAGRFVEADMIVESDLATQLGGDYRWTTGDTTAADTLGGELALIDVATHEFGHWAGLGHVNHSPELTMYPAVRDGMQTLGLGDMKGVLTRY
jgi:hypothetical protein